MFSVLFLSTMFLNSKTWMYSKNANPNNKPMYGFQPKIPNFFLQATYAWNTLFSQIKQRIRYSNRDMQLLNTTDFIQNVMRYNKINFLSAV